MKPASSRSRPDLAAMTLLPFMRHALVALCVLHCANSGLASPVLGLETHTLADAIEGPSIDRRQGAFQPVTGVAFGIRPRLEIRQMQQNADQWNIYLLGLARFQAANQTDKLSYYQIAG